MQIHQHLVGEPGTDLASRLILFRIGVIACEQECSIGVGSLALSIVSTNDDQVTRISYSGEVILLELFICRNVSQSPCG